ncbi:MAG TPA: hypothetical protein VJZ32_12345 [Candidatus Bathyarchaeia archaeon]|nr:hypothetical protein [Candidatus Bathyarchaeia archaeon]
MDWNEFAEYVLATDPLIRYVGVVDNQYRLILSKNRPGNVPFISDETDRRYLPIAPPIILEAVEKLEGFVGNLQGVVARYEKLVFAFFRYEDHSIILTAETSAETPLITKVSRALKELSSKSKR